MERKMSGNEKRFFFTHNRTNVRLHKNPGIVDCMGLWAIWQGYHMPKIIYLKSKIKINFVIQIVFLLRYCGVPLYTEK